MDDFDLICLHEHYAEYWYEYEDIDDDTNNQSTVLATKQDTSIPFYFAPEGSKKYFFINNWTEHHGSY